MMECVKIQSYVKCMYKGRIVISHEWTWIWKQSAHLGWKGWKNDNSMIGRQNGRPYGGFLLTKPKLGYVIWGFLIGKILKLMLRTCKNDAGNEAFVFNLMKN